MKLTIPKICSYLGGIFLIALGVNLSKMAGLGISPVASVPHAIELILGIELGLATFITYIFLILLQLILLRKLSLAPFFQLLTTIIMSSFITATSPTFLLKRLVKPTSYTHSLLLLAISIVLIGIGVFFYIKPNYIPIPSEGVAKAIVAAGKGKLQFQSAKVIVDCSLVLISGILTFFAFGNVSGIREGTVITAVLVGQIVGVCQRIEKKLKYNHLGELL